MGQISCSHCQEIITHTNIVKNEYNFCCEGCLQVFFILKNEGDNTYYDLCEFAETKPIKASVSKSYLEFLSELEQRENLLQLGTWNDSIHQVTLYSEEMHCTACSWLIEKSLSKLKGIKLSQIHFIEGSLYLKYDSSIITLKEILIELSKYGYSFKPESKTSTDKISDHLLIRIAVSGAVFSNVMIFSIANYFGVYQGILRQWESYFNYASFFLNLPVVFYCAFPFFQKAYFGLKQKVLHMDLPISMGIIINFILSTYSLLEGNNLFFDGLAGIVFFLLCGRWLVNHFEHKLMPDPNWFNNIFAQQIRLLEDIKSFKSVWIKPSEINIDSLLILKAGEYTPIKCELVSEAGLLDPQLMTGESHLIKKQKGEEIPAGFLVVDKDLTIKSLENWKDSSLSLMKDQWNHLNHYQSKKTNAEKIVPWFTGSLFLISFILFFFTPDTKEALTRIGVLFIISCPCALALARPLSLGFALNRARDYGFLIKSEEVILKLSKVQSIFFDKTGTLTSSRKKISSWQGQSLSDPYKAALNLLCQGSVHPVAQSIAREFSEHNQGKILDRNEIINWGLKAQISDELNSSLSEFEIHFGRSDFSNTNFSLEQVPSEYSTYQNAIWIDKKWIASINFSDEIKEGVLDSLEQLQKAHIKTFLVSGDSKSRVSEFIKKCPSLIGFGGLSPTEKLELITKEQQNKTVMAIGDGLNDTLLLKKADLSILAEGGFQALTNGVDMISYKDNWASLSKLLNLGALAKKSIRAAYVTSLIYNSLALYFAFSGVLAPMVAAIAMPISSLSVCLVIALIFKNK